MLVAFAKPKCTSTAQPLQELDPSKQVTGASASHPHPKSVAQSPPSSGQPGISLLHQGKPLQLLPSSA